MDYYMNFNIENNNRGKIYDLDDQSIVFEWSQHFSEEVKRCLYNLFVLYTFRFSVDVVGGKGTGRAIEIALSEDGFKNFKDNFNLGKKTYPNPLKGAKHSMPFHKGEFKQERWSLKSLQNVQDLFSMFKNIKPETELVYFQDIKQLSHVDKVNSSVYEEIKKDHERYIQFCNQKGFSQVGEIKASLVVGERTGRKGNFNITYVRYPPMDGGFLRLNFFYESSKWGNYIDSCDINKNKEDVFDGLLPQNPFTLENYSDDFKSLFSETEMQEVINGDNKKKRTREIREQRKRQRIN